MTGKEYEFAVYKYSPHIFRLIHSICRNAEDAEDILQNVFLKLYLHERDFSNEEHMKRWLILVAVNESKNILKTAWRKKVVPMADVANVLEFKSERNIGLYEEVKKLPYKYSIVIHLYYYEGYSVKEISEILHLKESAVLMRMKRGREKLKDFLKEDGYGQ